VSIPFATTTIGVWRAPTPAPDDEGDWPDPTDPVVRSKVFTGVRAHISTSSGRENVASGSLREVADFRLSCDPVDGGLRHTDVVEDETTGEQFEVTWAHSRYPQGLGMHHEQAGLRRFSTAGEVP
jgi:hypothetical protein